MAEPVATALPASITGQIRNAGLRTSQIDAAAQHLARLMSEIHGQEWDCHFSHIAGQEFVLLSPQFSKDH